MGTICWKCGREVPAGSASCQACGAAIAPTGGQAAQPTPPPSSFSSSPAGFTPGAGSFSSTPSSIPSGQGYSSPPPPPSAGQFQPGAPVPPPSFSSTPPPQPGYAPVQPSLTPLPPPPLPPPAQPPPGASGGGSTAIKIVLIVVGIVVFIIIMIVAVIGYIGYRTVHAFKDAANGEKITIPGGNGGSFSVNTAKTYTASELGVDIYPGAKSIRGGMKMDLPTGSMTTGIFITSDSKDQVVAFYKDKFGAGSGLMDSDEAAVLSIKKSDKDTVMVTVSNKANENDGKTKIAIVHTVSK